MLYMKKIFKWLAIFAGIMVAAIALFLFSMRFSDGPKVVFSGGPFTSGELTAAPDDWTYLQDRLEIEFQTIEPQTSRTVWLGVYDTRLFVVSGYMTTGYGRLWKQWPHYLEQDNRVILRIDDKLYNQRLSRVMQGPEVIPVLREFSRKYGLGEVVNGEQVTEGHTWMYEVVER